MVARRRGPRTESVAPRCEAIDLDLDLDLDLASSALPRG
jgi:hypothetical protein